MDHPSTGFPADDLGEGVEPDVDAHGRDAERTVDPWPCSIGHRESDSAARAAPQMSVPCATTVPSDPRSAISDNPSTGRGAAGGRSRLTAALKNRKA